MSYTVISFLYWDLHFGSDSAFIFEMLFSFANFFTCSTHIFRFLVLLISPPCLKISTLPAISVIVFVIFLSSCVKRCAVVCSTKIVFDDMLEIYHPSIVLYWLKGYSEINHSEYSCSQHYYSSDI
jgi:hypothetical protein